MVMVLTSILAIVSAIVPGGTTAVLVEKIIAMLIQIIPVVVKEYSDLLPIIRNIIAALKADPATTSAQLDQLQKVEVEWDSEFEAAAAAALAADKAT